MPTPDNCLNIGRDDFAKPAGFFHIPRPATLSPGINSCHRRFGGYFAVQLNQRTTGFGGSNGRVMVFRSAYENNGELDLEFCLDNGCSFRNTVTLTADEMQTLACALLDAAHDLRCNPAIASESEAVPA